MPRPTRTPTYTSHPCTPEEVFRIEGSIREASELRLRLAHEISMDVPRSGGIHEWNDTIYDGIKQCPSCGIIRALKTEVTSASLLSSIRHYAADAVRNGPYYYSHPGYFTHDNGYLDVEWTYSHWSPCFEEEFSYDLGRPINADE